MTVAYLITNLDGLVKILEGSLILRKDQNNTENEEHYSTKLQTLLPINKEEGSVLIEIDLQHRSLSRYLNCDSCGNYSIGLDINFDKNKIHISYKDNESYYIEIPFDTNCIKSITLIDKEDMDNCYNKRITSLLEEAGLSININKCVTE